MSGNSLELIRQLASRKGRVHFGRYAIEGTRIVERALRAEADLLLLLVGETALRDERIAALYQLGLEREISAEIITDADALILTNGRRLGDIFAIVQPSPEPAIESLKASQPLFLALVDIVEPGNVGAMIRTAHGFGASGVFTVGKSDPFNPKAVRTAMGSLFRMPILQFDTVAHFMQQMAQQQLETVALVAADGVALPTFEFAQSGSVIVMGNEFYGLSAETTAACTDRVTIPMSANIDSFSVSAAASVALYAASIQR